MSNNNNNNNNKDKEEDEYEKYCYLCKRPENISGPLMNLPGEIHICKIFGLSFFVNG